MRGGTVELFEEKADSPKNINLLDVTVSGSSTNLYGDSGLAKTDLEKLRPAIKTIREAHAGTQQINIQLEGWELIRAKDKQEAVKKLNRKIINGECNPYEVGKFGETILHYALLFRNEEIAEYLMNHRKYGSTLRKAVYGKSKYKKDVVDFYQGEGCLHLAIANRSKKMVMLLLDYETSLDQPMDEHELSFFNSEVPRDLGYPLNTQRATGQFFEGKLRNSVFWGETALDFAVSTNQPDMVDILMGFNYVAEDDDSFDFIRTTVAKKRKFNGKWRSSLKLRDTKHQNTVFHLCALKGHTSMWHSLTEHLEATIEAESTFDDYLILELAAEKWVRSQVNKYGFTPLQLAAYNNQTKMVKTILSKTRIRLWKWGDQAYHAYTLNEIDDFFKDAETTPGIPITSIILSEGNFELFSLEVISKLMQDKWDCFGKTWTTIFCIIQLFFIFTLTVLFLQSHPDLENLDADWGKNSVNTWWHYLCYIFVLCKTVWEIIAMVTEMGIIFFNNLELQKYVLQQKLESQRQIRNTERLNGLNSDQMSFNDASAEIDDLTTTTNEKIAAMLARETWCDKIKRCRLSFRWMKSLYFETLIPEVPDCFRDGSLQKQNQHSVAGFFLTNSWLSNIAFFTAQIMVLYPTRGTARGLTYLMIFIIVLEYLQLFLWLQTNKQVGRFISAMVIIIYKDVKGFLVVLLVILLAFSACFILLLEKSENMKQWASLSWMIYELSVGTGEFFAEEMDSMDVGGSIDPYRRTLVYLTYVAYITLMLVVIMNLLIAVMSETTDTLSSEMMSREKRLKLSSISLIARRLHTIRIFTRGCCRRINTIGGKRGNTVNLNILDDLDESKQSFDALKTLKTYYKSIYYLCSLEEESMDIDKDGRIQINPCEEKSKEDEMIDILKFMKKWILNGPVSSLAGMKRIKDDYEHIMAQARAKTT